MGRKLSGQWTKGKSCDTFGPTGPWMVTKDEIDDVQKLDMWLDVNGKRMQTGNTSTMIFTVAQIMFMFHGSGHVEPYDRIAPVRLMEDCECSKGRWLVGL